jgi:hypothetical protein
MVRWCDGGVNQGLLPMTISEEESNLFCAFHLLKPVGQYRQYRQYRHLTGPAGVGLGQRQ